MDADKISELTKYFRSRKPECTIRHDWDFDHRTVRFRFVENLTNKYILDLDADIIEQHEPDEITEQLEDNHWERVLDENSEHIATFTTAAFHFRPRHH